MRILDRANTRAPAESTVAWQMIGFRDLGPKTLDQNSGMWLQLVDHPWH